MTLISTLLLSAIAVSTNGLTRSVEFSSVATGIDPSAAVEFLFAGPGSDHDYESLFLTEDGPEAIAAAFDLAGIPRGLPTHVRDCRFWPAGEKVSVEPSLSEYLVDNQKSFPEIIWTAGAREGDDRPVAATNMPLAVFSLYSHPQSLMQFDAALEQSVTYGRFRARRAMTKGEKVRFKFTWKGEATYEHQTKKLESGKIKEFLLALKEESKDRALELLLEFSPTMSVAEARDYALALDILDSAKIKINGFPKGQFFYRAYLPQESWRDRKERLVQPLEVYLGATNRVVEILEDWSGPDPDPKLTAVEHKLEDVDKIKSQDVDTVLFFTPKTMTLAEIFSVAAKMPRSVHNWYVYGE